MSNTLTNLIPTIYNALDVVSRELVGIVPAVSSDMTYERAAVGQTVRSPVTPAATATDITPGVTPPDDGNQTIGSVSMTISKARRVPVRWNGEEKLGLDNNGASFNVIFRDQMAQAMRTLVNEVETDLGALYAKAAGGVYGTAGTTPFASSLADTANMRKLLANRGAPMSDLQMVIDTGAGAKMRTLTQLTKANEAGDTSLLRRGVLLDIHGFAIRESAGIATQTGAGTASGATTDTTGYAVGATSITIASAGTGTIVAGNLIQFAGDEHVYKVATGDTDVSNGGTIVLSNGLYKAIPASATAITVVGNGVRNLAFARSAIVLATRAPALPEQGDLARDRQLITDPMSGLTFEVAMYPQYRQMQYEVSLAWGCEVVKPEHLALLIG